MTGVVAVGLLAIALAGCGPERSGGDAAASGSATPSASPSSVSAAPSQSASDPSIARGEPTPGTPAPAAQTVTLQISGGFVGRKDEVTVTPDGAWTFVDGRKGVTRHGHLTAAQRDELSRLVHSSTLRTEARQKPPKPGCADGISYRLRVGSLSLVRADCGTSQQTPTLNDLITLLTKATSSS
ncbi:MAG: hypothetical protein WCA46_06350 [Actinocatenispora sp.]